MRVWKNALVLKGPNYHHSWRAAYNFAAFAAVPVRTCWPYVYNFRLRGVKCKNCGFPESIDKWAVVGRYAVPASVYFGMA